MNNSITFPFRGVKFSQYLCVKRNNTVEINFNSILISVLWRKNFSRGPIECIMQKIAG